MVGLYLGRRHPEYIQSRVARAILDAHTNDADWITSTRLHHAVGVAIHTTLLDDMLASMNPHQPIDEALSTWAVQHGHTIAYTHPSLLDHLDVEPVIQDRRPRQRLGRAGNLADNLTARRVGSKRVASPSEGDRWLEDR